jgi:hypothetical protein
MSVLLSETSFWPLEPLGRLWHNGMRRGLSVADVVEYLPWSVADRLFRPDNEESYPGTLQGISKARSVLGFLLVAYFSLANGIWPLDEIAFVRTAVMAAFAAAAWICLLLLVSRRPLAASVKEDCWRVLRRVLALFVSVAIGSVLLVIPVLNFVAAFWLFFYVFWAFWLICRYQFGAGDASPLLAPLVTATTAALLGAYNLATIHTQKIPPRLDELIVLSGVGTTSLLALGEFLVLRHRGERFSTEPAQAAAAGWAGGHQPSGPAGGPYPRASQPSYQQRRSPSTAKRTAAVVAAVAALSLLWLAAQGIGRGGAGHPPSSQQPGTAAPGSPANPARGTLTIRLNHDYILAVGSPYPIARAGGADVGHLTGTPSGVDVADAWALPLPRGVRGGYQSCLALNWTGTRVWGVGHVIPWTALWPGRQICVQTTYSGLYVSLLTVSRRPAGARVAFRVDTWSCSARPGESAIC